MIIYVFVWSIRKKNIFINQLSFAFNWLKQSKNLHNRLTNTLTNKITSKFIIIFIFFAKQIDWAMTLID